MLTRRMLVALAAIAMLSSSTVFAGGGNGGSKADPIIKVRNDTNGPIAAFINPNPAKIAILAAIPAANRTEQDIKDAGGKLVNQGATVEFKVKAGTYDLAAGSDPAFPAVVPAIVTANGKVYNYAYNELGGFPQLVKF